MWYLSESCVTVMLSESFLWFLYEATRHQTTYKWSSTSWRWLIYQTGTESLSVVSTDPCWFIWYLSRPCLILLSVFWWSMQKWPWVWEKHYITKTTTLHSSSFLLLCFSTFSFLLSCSSSSAALSLCLSPSSTSLSLSLMADIIDFLYEKTLPKLEEDLKGCKDDDDEPAETRQSYKLSEILPNLWNTPTPPPLITRGLCDSLCQMRFKLNIFRNVNDWRKYQL